MPYSIPTREDDPVHLVRTIARLAQMLVELRDEYVRNPREDTLDQIERRLDELSVLRQQLRERRDEQRFEAEGAAEEL